MTAGRERCSFLKDGDVEDQPVGLILMKRSIETKPRGELLGVRRSEFLQKGTSLTRRGEE